MITIDKKSCSTPHFLEIYKIILLAHNMSFQFNYTFPNLSLEDLSGPEIGVGEGSGRIVAQRG